MAEMGESVQLDFNQAMHDFRTMFPDMDADVIEAVLRANRGAVHATIDQLLSMATDVENQKTSLQPDVCHVETPPVIDRPRGLEGATNYELPPSYALSATPPPSYHQAVPSPYRSPARLGSEVTDGKRGGGGAMKHWNPPLLLPLPSDFLRIVPSPHHGVAVLSPQRLSERLSENALAREAVGESDLELAQYLKDERIALFLQNDEFISELRSNQEFMSALQREHDGDYEIEDDFDIEEGGQSHRGRKMTRKGDAAAGGGGIPPLDDATFKERLSTMGKASRKKFAQIAKVFSRGKRGAGARSLLPSVGTSATNGKDLLMSSDPLIDDYDEDRPQSLSDLTTSSSPRGHP